MMEISFHSERTSPSIMLSMDNVLIILGSVKHQT